MLIYKVTNKVNGLVYIGQTSKTLEERRYRHEHNCLYNKRKIVKFHIALKEYGFDNFTWEAIKKCNSQEELDYYEKYYIKAYNSCDERFGYNLKFGGRFGGFFNDEAKKNLGNSTKLKWKNPECARKMREGLQKGVNTMKEKGVANYIEHVCPVCGKTFKTKNWNSHTYCSLKCANSNLKETLKFKSGLGVQKIKEQYVETRNKRYILILDWLKSNNEFVANAKMNNLKFLYQLCEHIGVKDTRSLGKVLGVIHKKEIVAELKNIIKCTPFHPTNNSEYSKEETPGSRG